MKETIEESGVPASQQQRQPEVDGSGEPSAGKSQGRLEVVAAAAKTTAGYGIAQWQLKSPAQANKPRPAHDFLQITEIENVSSFVLQTEKKTTTADCYYGFK